ncbi:hypothetical protein EWB00_008569, partial [Schistosoma japonicum]
MSNPTIKVSLSKDAIDRRKISEHISNIKSSTIQFEKHYQQGRASSERLCKICVCIYIDSSDRMKVRQISNDNQHSELGDFL